MNESPKYTVVGNMVRGGGWSYSLKSKVDAERLCKQLNNYEKQIRLQKLLMVLKMDVEIIKRDIEPLKELLK